MEDSMTDQIATHADGTVCTRATSTRDCELSHRYAPAPVPLDTEKVTHERLAEPGRLYCDLEYCLSEVDDYLRSLYPDNSFDPTLMQRRDALGALEEIERLARALRADIEGRN